MIKRIIFKYNDSDKIQPNTLNTGKITATIRRGLFVLTCKFLERMVLHWRNIFTVKDV